MLQLAFLLMCRAGLGLDRMCMGSGRVRLAGWIQFCVLWCLVDAWCFQCRRWQSCPGQGRHMFGLLDLNWRCCWSAILTAPWCVFSWFLLRVHCWESLMLWKLCSARAADLSSQCQWVAGWDASYYKSDSPIFLLQFLPIWPFFRQSSGHCFLFYFRVMWLWLEFDAICYCLLALKDFT